MTAVKNAFASHGDFILLMFLSLAVAGGRGFRKWTHGKHGIYGNSPDTSAIVFPRERQSPDWLPLLLQTICRGQESRKFKDGMEPIRRLACPGLAPVQRTIPKPSSTSAFMIKPVTPMLPMSDQTVVSRQIDTGKQKPAGRRFVERYPFFRSAAGDIARSVRNGQCGVF
jgi:hypothetical protein